MRGGEDRTTCCGLLEVGEQVEYWSVSAGRWLPAKAALRHVSTGFHKLFLWHRAHDSSQSRSRSFGWTSAAATSTSSSLAAASLTRAALTLSDRLFILRREVFSQVGRANRKNPAADWSRHGPQARVGAGSPRGACAARADASDARARFNPDASPGAPSQASASATSKTGAPSGDGRVLVRGGG